MSKKREFKDLDNCDPRTCLSAKVLLISRITAGIFRKYLGPFNITDSQLSVLFILEKKGGMTQKELSEIVRLEKSSLNRNITRMIENGFLTRKKFPVIDITIKGKELANNVVPEWNKAMDEMHSFLDQDGEEALELVLNKLTNPK